MAKAAGRMPGWVTKRPEGLQRLLDEGFDERATRFRKDGQALSLNEVPKVVDQLLDLRSTERRLLLWELGLDYRALLRERKLPSGPTTVEQLVHVLSGGLMAEKRPLPATILQARWRLKEKGADALLSSGSEQAHFARDAFESLKVAKGLGGLKRLRWYQRVGGYAQIGFHTRFFQAPAETYKKHDNKVLNSLGVKERPLTRVPNGAADQGGFIKLTSRHGKAGTGALLDLSGKNLPVKAAEIASKMTSLQLSTSFGTEIGEVDRRTGKRIFRPYATEVLKSTFATVGYTWARGQRGPTVKLGFTLAQLGWGPVFGTSFRITIPWVGALFISERYIGGGIFKRGKLKEGFAVPGIDWLRIPFSAAAGIGGDSVEYVTGPVLRWLEDQLEKLRNLKTRFLEYKENGELLSGTLDKVKSHSPSLGFEVRDQRRDGEEAEDRRAPRPYRGRAPSRDRDVIGIDIGPARARE